MVKKEEGNTIEQYENTTAGDILNRAAETGTLMSSGHQQATENAQSALLKDLGDIDVGIREPAYESGMNRGLQAAGEQVQGQLAANQALGSAGSQEQQQGQNFLDTAYHNLYRAWELPQPALSQATGGFG